MMSMRISNFFVLLLVVSVLAACGGGSGSSSGDSGATSWANVGIAPANRQITVSWSKTGKTTAGAGATYTLYWSNTPGVTKSTGARIRNVVSPYVHTGLTNGTPYYYVITETVSGVEGAASLEVAAMPTAVLPARPTGITILPQNGAVQLKLDRTGIPSTTRYNLYWSSGAVATAAVTKIANAFGSGTTFLHTGLTNGTPYYYAVAAETTAGEGPRSKIMATIPQADRPATNYVLGVSAATLAAPNAISITPGNQQATLTWNMPAVLLPTVFDPVATPTQPPVISSYTIYWSTAPIDATATAISVPVTTTPITFKHTTGLTNGVPYYFAISAVAATDASGTPLQTAAGQPLVFESSISSQSSVTPEAKIPPAPAGFSAVSGNQQITLAWVKDAAATATYRVYGSRTAPSQPEGLVDPGNLLASVTANSFIHSGLASGAYYYVVTTVTESESVPGPLVAVTLP